MVCLYTDERRPLVLALALRAGAAGVVHKSAPPEAVSNAIVEVRQGRVALPQAMIGLTELLDRRGAPIELTERQRQVLSARARGRTWADTSGRLFITEDTAREHYRAVCAKLRDYVQHTSPSELEHALGLRPGDILDEDLERGSTNAP